MAELSSGGVPLLTTGLADPTPETLALIGEEPGRRLLPRTESLLPYSSQSRYGREVSSVETPVAVLENDRLRATFLLDLGGRLWSLFDKQRGKELLFQPDAIQFGNLALRDAWFSGGVEWNLGVTGHWGLTCSPVCAGIVDDSILRMWAYERLTGLVWRVEASLDDDRLLIGVRLNNPHAEPIGLYWWSNTAVPMEHSNILVDASSALCHGYDQRLSRVAWPVADPQREEDAADYFFEINSPWQAALGQDGYGLLEVSTKELHGRKLFVWGAGSGGRRWQRWLNGTGAYVEVQAGYARTQHEHIALDPGAEVSWIESYGPIQLANGETPEPAELPDPFIALANHPPEVWRATDGWGWLEVQAGQLKADPATPFEAGSDPEPLAWAEFLHTGQVPELDSPVVGDRWLVRLLEADESPWQALHLGYARWARGERAQAVSSWERSVELAMTSPALWALSQTATEGWQRFDWAEQAWQLDPQCVERLVEYLKLARHLPQIVVRTVRSLPDHQQNLPGVRLELAHALIATKQLEQARQIIEGFELPNLREGSGDLTSLWVALQDASGSNDPLPAELDFRMH